MKTIYLDCSAGISGDMFTGAMLGLGIDREKLASDLSALGTGDFEVAFGKTEKCGVAADTFRVRLLPAPHGAEHGAAHAHRHLAEIGALFDAAPLGERVKALAKKIFALVAQAEGQVHGLPPEEVHFHEVGAADSIADIAAAALCMEQLGFPRVLCSPLREGSGFVRCAHGLLPVPVPATAAILSAAGLPFSTSAAQGEMITPTGAAIAAALCESAGPMPEMRVERIGYGAGEKDFPHPNILRAFLGEAAESPAAEEPADSAEPDSVEVLETCIDDSTGEELGSCLDALFALGAADAYFTPIYMKKCRPAVLLTVLCSRELRQRAAELIFSRTGAIGLRVRTSRRIVMEREIREVDTPYGKIPVKFARYGSIRKCKPERSAVEAAAAAHGVSPRTVSASCASCAGGSSNGAEC